MKNNALVLLASISWVAFASFAAAAAAMYDQPTGGDPCDGHGDPTQLTYWNDPMTGHLMRCFYGEYVQDLG